MKLRMRLLRLLARLLHVPLGMIAESPWMRVRELPDERDRAYLWILGPSSNKDDVLSFQRNLASIFVRERGREPLALHLVVRHPVDLHDLTEQDVRSYVKPWLQNAHAQPPPEES